MILPTGIPWRLVGIVAGVALLVWAGWWITGRIRVSYQAELERDQAIAQYAAYMKTVDHEVARAKLRQALDQEADAKLAGRLDAYEDQAARLRAAAARVPPTMEKTDANGVTRVAVNADWWLCTSTHVTRDPADTATCEAHASASGVPAAVSH